MTRDDALASAPGDGSFCGGGSLLVAVSLSGQQGCGAFATMRVLVGDRVQLHLDMVLCPVCCCG